MDTNTMLFSEMIRAEIKGVVDAGGNVEEAAKNIMIDVMHDKAAMKSAPCEAIRTAAFRIVTDTVEFSGDYCAAARGALEGAIEGSKKARLEADEAASAAATAAVTAGYEIHPNIGTKIKKTVSVTRAGKKVLIVKPAPVFTRPQPVEEEVTVDAA